MGNKNLMLGPLNIPLVENSFTDFCKIVKFAKRSTN